jgi:hypothetical protein
VSAGEVVAIVCAGVAAGTINTVVGSGTLITFPVLLAFGYAPVTANVSNTVGLVPGSVSGAYGYRRELAGAVLLLVLPSSAFKAIVPVFIAAALVATLLQPRINRALARRAPGREQRGGVLTPLAIYITGVYGGYFGAAQGILLLAILGIALAQDLHRSNALKNVLAGLVNGVAGLYFIFAADVRWLPAALIAGGSIVGAQLGARYGRRLPAGALRALIVAVGIYAIVQLVA